MIVLPIMRTTIGAILRMKLLYVALILVVLISAISVVPYAMMQLATEAGEATMAQSLRSSLIMSAFSMWAVVTMGFGLYLGSSAISSEVKAKTIVTVLSKPVERWEFLFAKWLGIQVFALSFFVVGIVFTSLLLVMIDAHVSPAFWLGAAQMFIQVMLVSTSCIALGTIVSPLVAGAVPVVLSILHTVSAQFLEHPLALIRLPAQAFQLLMPAGMPDNLITQGLDRDVLDPEYGTYLQVLLENGLYVFFILLFAFVVFGSRELRLK
jgi:ABC-type transport system involved in multi-copper enzyme maturation permease subunit